MISIVDYGSGNILAIRNIYNRLNMQCEIVGDVSSLTKASKIIIPGVGAFDETMQKLNDSGMRDCLDDLVLNKGVPVLGVCVGMQIMASKSEEGELRGLGWFDAEIKKIDETKLLEKPKVPHMGWNTARPVRSHPIFNLVDSDKGFYFLHSYYFSCNDANDVLAVTQYGEEFSSAVNKDNVFGFQFHPEKSHTNGVNLFKNFAELQVC